MILCQSKNPAAFLEKKSQKKKKFSKKKIFLWIWIYPDPQKKTKKKNKKKIWDLFSKNGPSFWSKVGLVKPWSSFENSYGIIIMDLDSIVLQLVYYIIIVEWWVKN